jgi:hypothetical protein
MPQSYDHAMNRFFSSSSSPSSYLSPLPKSSTNSPYLPNLGCFFPPSQIGQGLFLTHFTLFVGVFVEVLAVHKLVLQEVVPIWVELAFVVVDVAFMTHGG